MDRVLCFASAMTAAASALFLGLALATMSSVAMADENLSANCNDAQCDCPTACLAAPCPSCRCAMGFCVT